MATTNPGFSLVEMLLASALLALITGMALPEMSRWLADASAERTLHRINGALAYARTIAVVEGTPVVLCPLSEDRRCDGAWSEGFALFRDPERQARLRAGEKPVRVFPASDERIVLRAFRTTRYFRFLPNGQTDWQNGRFIVCPTDPQARVRGLVLNVQGRPRVLHDAQDATPCASET